jgi:hypothetical protein
MVFEYGSIDDGSGTARSVKTRRAQAGSRVQSS